MKKNFYYLFGVTLVTMMSAGFVSCGDDDEKDDGVDTTPISIYAGTDKVISGADTISSSNKFVAYGTKNTVHAWHVGETALKVNGKQTISISVHPLYHLYDDPICNWGCSMDYVKSHQKQGTINSKSTSEMLAYDNAGGATLLMYQFKDGKLSAVMAMVSTNHSSTLADYLGERYLLLPYYQGEKEYFVGMDGLDRETAKSMVMMELYNSSNWAIMYTNASSSSKARSGEIDFDTKKKLARKLVQFL